MPFTTQPFIKTQDVLKPKFQYHMQIKFKSFHQKPTKYLEPQKKKKKKK